MRETVISFRKIITAGGFWLCAAMSLVLLCCSDIYTDFDTQNRYSVVRAVLELPADVKSANVELCSAMVIRNARGAWFAQFAPILAAFCFVPQMCAEREENAVRFQIFRSSKLKWEISRFVSAVVSGGAAIMLGYMVFSAAALLIFPNVSEMTGFAAELATGTTLNYFAEIMRVLLYGMFWSIPSLVLASVLRNKYIIMCVPFFVKYALTGLCAKLTNNALFSETVDAQTLRFANFIDPDRILWVNSEQVLGAVILFGGFALVFFAAYLFAARKRGDCGA